MSTSVRSEIIVEAPPERAFRVFTQKIESWWPSSHHISKVPMKNVIMDGRENGRWYEVGTDGSQCDWGRVLVWDPPRRLVLAWQLTAEWQFDADFMTEVEINFVPVDNRRTRVALEHRNLERYGVKAAEVRDAIGGDMGWPKILEGYAAVVPSLHAAYAPASSADGP